MAFFVGGGSSRYAVMSFNKKEDIKKTINFGNIEPKRNEAMEIPTDFWSLINTSSTSSILSSFVDNHTHRSVHNRNVSHYAKNFKTTSIHYFYFSISIC